MKKRLINLVEKEGFILVLFLCVCVVAGGTLFVSMRSLSTTKGNPGNDDFMILEDDLVGKSHLNGEDSELAILTDEEIKDLNSDESVEEVVEVILAEDDYAESEVDVEDLEFEEDVKDAELVVEEKTLLLPLDGPTITKYTTDALVYSATLESWVGHGAIDIGAKEGTPVKAAMDGIVKEVYEDELWGIVIVIDHENLIETRYSNLSNKEMVKAGLRVKKGDHISTVGKTAKIEMLIEPHVHFEVTKNGKIVDPRSIID